MRRLPVNQGKGGAVIAGLELAAQAGFTHALQIDADGQHDLAALPALLDAGRAQPDAIVLGAPVYDRAMPVGRRLGRWITHAWICLETLSPRVLDTMCGFRVYPLAPTMAALRVERIGRRMDFDPEIVVHLIWRGMRPVTVPVGVRYPEDNLSNFRLLRDNWAITRMHTRLVLTLLARLPRILRERARREETPRHWSGLGERGAYWGLRLSGALYRLIGRRGVLTMLLPVVLYFHLTGAAQRRASRDFLSRAFAARGERRRLGPLAALRHSFAFARNALETFGAWMGDASAVEIANEAEMARALASRRGLLLVVSHFGNADLSRAALEKDHRSRLTVLVHTRHAENYARLVQRFRPEAALNTLQVTEITPATIIALQERIEAGGWIAIAGDRTPVQGDARVSPANFLGAEALFPQGPYLLAHLLECPVYLLFCVREGGVYRLHFERLAERIELPRRGREDALGHWARSYAQRLEAFCLRDPYQWYNFFDFWAPKSRPAGAR